jgi:hypothetical protein
MIYEGKTFDLEGRVWSPVGKEWKNLHSNLSHDDHRAVEIIYHFLQDEKQLLVYTPTWVEPGFTGIVGVSYDFATELNKQKMVKNLMKKKNILENRKFPSGTRLAFDIPQDSIWAKTEEELHEKKLRYPINQDSIEFSTAPQIPRYAVNFMEKTPSSRDDLGKIVNAAFTVEPEYFDETLIDRLRVLARLNKKFSSIRVALYDAKTLGLVY